MKPRFFLPAFLISFNIVTASHASELVLIIDGFQSDDGYAMVALVNSQKTFIARKGGPDPYKAARIKIKNGNAKSIFKSLPHDEYAIKVFHDENNNQNLDTGFLGIPLEDYGFSNNAKGAFGPPSYDAAKFIINTEKQAIHIHM
jgi:uncharacterized protein (DUF2141 family)